MPTVDEVREYVERYRKLKAELREKLVENGVMTSVNAHRLTLEELRQAARQAGIFWSESR